ncbi:hypothetical protein SBI_09719 [Streptomyces bingchenggensis BCW-1]|uniref:Uncharacterized protein n=1 Tax=Streptomyces bingchenggensis (strain BCW-1) TaxID=749414 RepID=D7CBG0_STRBB|nr:MULTISPECIES: hypothetical protein [Streptomyces]ADI12837.1 hypothetical protein SBI_09719 [Streptomyces bingchenggensis BCW-1]
MTLPLVLEASGWLWLYVASLLKPEAWFSGSEGLPGEPFHQLGIGAAAGAGDAGADRALGADDLRLALSVLILGLGERPAQRGDRRRFDALFDLADTIITIRNLIRRAWTTHRWDERPNHRP